MVTFTPQVLYLVGVALCFLGYAVNGQDVENCSGQVDLILVGSGSNPLSFTQASDLCVNAGGRLSVWDDQADYSRYKSAAESLTFDVSFNFAAWIGAQATNLFIGSFEIQNFSWTATGEPLDEFIESFENPDTTSSDGCMGLHFYGPLQLFMPNDCAGQYDFGGNSRQLTRALCEICPTTQPTSSPITFSPTLSPTSATESFLLIGTIVPAGFALCALLCACIAYSKK